MHRLSESRVAVTVGSALAALILLLAFAAAADGVPPRGAGTEGPARGGDPAGGGARRGSAAHGPSAGESEKQLTNPAEAAGPTGAGLLGASGQVDPLSGLGIANPVCDRPGEIRDRDTRLSCEVNGTPETTYPASNYGFDIFIDAGIDAPTGTFAKGFVMILNGLWLGLIFVLKLVLALLGLAFGLNPFAEGETMREISSAVGRLYARVTQPWLSTAVVCGGIWFAYKGLVRREVAAGVGGTLAALAMIVVGLWVIHQPQASVGRLATISDRMALGIIGAPQAGTASRPAGSYAEAMSRLWSRLVEVPFAGLDFSDVGWALGRPPAEAIEKADEKFCDDHGALALMAELARLGSEDAKRACGEFAAERYGRPRRVIDLYLRSSPGSPARQALWDSFDNDDTYKPKVAAQGGDGVLTRLSMLALFAIGLTGAVLLLAWLAIRLFSQAAIAFVLLLAAPFALFFPLLGDAGRRAFRTWGMTLLGAVVAKVIYAAFLSIVLLGITILGEVEGPGGSATGFLLSCAFAWSVFLKRAQLVGRLNVGEAEKMAGRGLIAPLAAAGLVRGARRRVGGTAKEIGRRSVGSTRARGAEFNARMTRNSLGRSARALAEHRHGEATQTVAAFEARGGHRGPREQVAPASAPGDLTAPARNPGRAAPATRPATEAEWQRYEGAKELLGRAAAGKARHGEKWSAAYLSEIAEEDSRLLWGPADPAEHAHRVGLDRRRFEELQDPEREAAIEAIEKARLRDLRRQEVPRTEPGRIRKTGSRPGRSSSPRATESSPERLQRLQRLRRPLGRALDQGLRRNLSRRGGR